MTPKFNHSCSSCVYLGCYYYGDLYACAAHGKIKTLIFRHGSEPHRFQSGLGTAIYFMENDRTSEPLAVALKRALELGYRI